MYSDDDKEAMDIDAAFEDQFRYDLPPSPPKPSVRKFPLKQQRHRLANKTEITPKHVLPLRTSQRKKKTYGPVATQGMPSLLSRNTRSNNTADSPSVQSSLSTDKSASVSSPSRASDEQNNNDEEYRCNVAVSQRRASLRTPRKRQAISSRTSRQTSQDDSEENDDDDSEEEVEDEEDDNIERTRTGRKMIRRSKIIQTDSDRRRRMYPLFCLDFPHDFDVSCCMNSSRICSPYRRATAQSEIDSGRYAAYVTRLKHKCICFAKLS